MHRQATPILTLGKPTFPNVRTSEMHTAPNGQTDAQTQQRTPFFANSEILQIMQDTGAMDGFALEWLEYLRAPVATSQEQN